MPLRGDVDVVETKTADYVKSQFTVLRRRALSTLCGVLSYGAGTITIPADRRCCELPRCLSRLYCTTILCCRVTDA